MRSVRVIVLAALALSGAAATTVAYAEGPYGQTVNNQVLNQKQVSLPRKTFDCKANWDATPNSGPPREQLSSAQCPAPAGARKGDACFCVVQVQGQPYAAGGKVAELLPGGGYSW
jgi:hypothetical protein